MSASTHPVEPEGYDATKQVMEYRNEILRAGLFLTANAVANLLPEMRVVVIGFHVGRPAQESAVVGTAEMDVVREFIRELSAHWDNQLHEPQIVLPEGHDA